MTLLNVILATWLLLGFASVAHVLLSKHSEIRWGHPNLPMVCVLGVLLGPLGLLPMWLVAAIVGRLGK